MLLNVSPNLWTLGEFHVLPWEVRENVKPCGCGIRVTECELWGPVIAKQRDVLLYGTIDKFRRAYNVDRTLRLAEVPSLLTGRLQSNKSKMKEVRRYADDNRSVLDAVQSRAVQLGRTSLTWLVDSSKSPYRLLWLAASGQFELKVIHLVKDPRAFVYSVAKHSTGISQAYWVARAAARWQVENRLFEILAHRYLHADQVFQLRYEQLAGHTDESLQELANWLKISAWRGASKLFREKNHGISGNPSRFESRGIQLDEQWKHRLPVVLQRLAFRCSWRLASRYGYEAT
jgi:hypothetical protein